MLQTQIVQHLPKRTLFYKAGLLMIFILEVSSIFSPIRALSFFNQIWAICIIGWFVFTFLENPYYLLLPTKHRVAIYVYLIYTIGLAYMTGNGIIGNRFFELSQLPLFYMAYEKNKLAGRNNDNLLIIKLIAPFILVTSFITLYAYRIDPYISRSLKTSQGLGLDYSKMGVGGYEFIYFLVIFTVILFFIFFEYKQYLKKIYRVIGFFITVMFGVNIILSNYSTALLLVILGGVIRLFFNRIKYSRIIFYFVFLLIIIVSFKSLMLFLLDGLTYYLDAGKNASTILEIKSFLLSGQMGNSIGARSDVFNESIQIFSQNPFAGIIIEPLKTNIYGEIIGFGQHSQVLDTFALFGGFIGVLQLYVYAQPILKRLKYKRGLISGFSLAILFVFIILITIDNATPSIGFAVFFIYPTLYDLYLEGKFKT